MPPCLSLQSTHFAGEKKRLDQSFLEKSTRGNCRTHTGLRRFGSAQQPWETSNSMLERNVAGNGFFHLSFRGSSQHVPLPSTAPSPGEVVQMIIIGLAELAIQPDCPSE